MTDQKKLEILLNELNHNVNSFSTALGYSRADKIYAIEKGRVNISRAVKRDIKRVFPQISSDWLEHSKGNITEIQNKEQQKGEIFELITELEANPNNQDWTRLKALVFEMIKDNELYKEKLLKIKEDLSTGIFKFFQ